MDTKSAIIFGATGLTGNHLLKLLMNDDRYSEVKTFVRRPSGIKHAKLDEHIVDFNQPDKFRKLITADEVFCCLGTTIRTAGSEAAFRKVDFEFVRFCAVAAAENGVKNFFVVSSFGANPGSKNFYLRTKGEMEKAVSAVSFEKCTIFRPSMLLGARKEFRFGEIIGKFFMRAFYFLIPKKYKPVQAKTVAQAMVRVANSEEKYSIVENELMLTLGK